MLELKAVLKKLLKPGFLIALFAFASMPQKLEASLSMPQKLVDKFGLSKNETIGVSAALAALTVAALVTLVTKLVKNKNKLAVELVIKKEVEKLLNQPLDNIPMDIVKKVATDNGITPEDFDKYIYSYSGLKGKNELSQNELRSLFKYAHQQIAPLKKTPAEHFKIFSKLTKTYRTLTQVQFKNLQNEPLPNVLKMINNQVKDKQLTTAEKLAVTNLTSKVVVEEIIAKDPAAWMVIVSKLDNGFTEKLPPEVREILEEMRNLKIDENPYLGKYRELRNILINKQDLVRELVGRTADAYLQLDLTGINKQRLDLFEKVKTYFNNYPHPLFTEYKDKAMYIIEHGNEENLKKLAGLILNKTLYKDNNFLKLLGDVKRAQKSGTEPHSGGTDIHAQKEKLPAEKLPGTKVVSEDDPVVGGHLKEAQN